VATVQDLSDPYAHFMLNPLPPSSADVCEICTTFTDGFPTCYPCGHNAAEADAVLPISYSVHFGQLHTSLAGYKRGTGRTAVQLRLQLGAVLWRFLDEHEQCLADAVGVDGFQIVTTVPSGSTKRDQTHPLPTIVGELVEPTRDRYERLLQRSVFDVADRTVDLRKYEPLRRLDGASVLLVDDTWTTGASVQSAAWQLKWSGAGAVGVIVIGRHVNEGYSNNAERLSALPRPFDWTICALH
jgi:hypothetical protein